MFILFRFGMLLINSLFITNRCHSSFYC